MPKLNVPPTKSRMLALRRELSFAEEGFELLDQKRRILIQELMSRLRQAREARQRVVHAVRAAHAKLRDALLECGSEPIDRAAVGAPPGPAVTLGWQTVAGVRLPTAQAESKLLGVPLDLDGTGASTDVAAERFAGLLPWIAELSAMETGLARLARELRRTQRRCNALSKLIIPAHRETIGYIRAALEERERESFVALKRIRARLGSGSGEAISRSNPVDLTRGPERISEGGDPGESGPGASAGRSGDHPHPTGGHDPTPRDAR